MKSIIRDILVRGFQYDTHFRYSFAQQKQKSETNLRKTIPMTVFTKIGIVFTNILTVFP